MIVNDPAYNHFFMTSITDYRHTMAEFLILCGPISNLNPKEILRFGYNGVVFCGNISLLNGQWFRSFVWPNWKYLLRLSHLYGKRLRVTLQFCFKCQIFFRFSYEICNELINPIKQICRTNGTFCQGSQNLSIDLKILQKTRHYFSWCISKFKPF